MKLKIKSNYPEARTDKKSADGENPRVRLGKDGSVIPLSRIRCNDISYGYYQTWQVLPVLMPKSGQSYTICLMLRTRTWLSGRPSLSHNWNAECSAIKTESKNVTRSDHIFCWKLKTEQEENHISSYNANLIFSGHDLVVILIMLLDHPFKSQIYFTGINHDRHSVWHIYVRPLLGHWYEWFLSLGIPHWIWHFHCSSVVVVVNWQSRLLSRAFNDLKRENIPM